ncbi:adhesion G-protein coupled receptor G4 [Orycteropus afer afer]|uniref:Adhesion G-protein coupled receptor G4 n=1 Tax=Orycteropus afer afer TaxID=1230840 RepID=A0A8B7B202_ORYAF|nr:adhesion G-protein coupled receptor G4 [Orycteropus afer afer]
MADTLSLRGKKLDFYGRDDMYVRLNNTIPELSRFTACIDLVFMDGKASDWIAFSYIINNTFLGKEDIDLGLAGDHQQLILHNLGKTFYIRYHLTPFQWHTICLIWDGVKGRLELFLNKERLLVMMDQPQNLTSNGTLVLGHFPKKGTSQAKRVVPGFIGSLYYFQLWNHILENEELTKCLDGNVVSWKEDAWLLNKIIPTVDKRLRCFVSDNITIQGTSTALSQQIDLTTSSQSTVLKPQKTLYSSTAVSKSIPVFASDYATIYSNTTSLETMTASKNFKPSIANTSTLAVDILSTSAPVTRPVMSTSIITTNNSMQTSKSSSSERMMTTKMTEAIASETFHPTTATDFLYTSGFTKNSVVAKTSATRFQSAIMKTTPLFSSTESTSMFTTSWPKHKSTDIGALPFSTTGQVFLEPSAAGTVPWSTVEQTSATTTHIGNASAFPPESELISTAALVDSAFSRNETASTSATTDTEIAFTVHLMTLPTKPIDITSSLKTARTELTSANFQDVSSPRVEGAISTSMPREASSMALSFRTSSPFIGAQSVQTVTDDETTLTVLTSRITLAPTVAETILSPTITGPVYTQNRPTFGENILPLSSTRSASTTKASGSGHTTITDESAHLFPTNETTWTSRSDQNLLTSINASTILTFIPNVNFTSAFHGGTSNTEQSFITTNIITPPEASTESEPTTATNAITATTDRYTTTVSKLTSLWFANSSTVSGTTSVPKPSELKLTTLLLKTTPRSTLAANALLSTPRGTGIPPEDMESTLADIKSNFSTEESSSETTQTDTNSTIVFGETTALVPKSVTTQIFNATVTIKETTSHYLKGKSTTAVTPEVSAFSMMLEATGESEQMVTASTISPFPNMEKITTPVDNKTATTETRSWLTTKSVKTTPKHLSSYNGTTDILNSTHTYTAHWTLETPLEGNSGPSPTSEDTQTFPELLDVSTARILGTIFSITTDRPAMSLSAGTLPSQPISIPSPATSGPVTHMLSLPVGGSVVTSMVGSDETKVTMPEPSTPTRAFSTSMLSDVSTLPSTTVTTAPLTTWGQTPSTTSNFMPTHKDSILTTSEATVISVRMTPMTVPSLTETTVPSMSPPTLITTKVDTALPSTSSDTVTPSTHTLTFSTSLPDNIPVVSSTNAMSIASTPVATQPKSQVAEATVPETSTHALNFLYTFSDDTDVLSFITGTTETSVVNETMPSHTSPNKLTTSVDVHSSQSSTHLVNTPVPTLLLTNTSAISSDKEQMITSLGNAPRTMEATEMSSSKNSFISYFQGTSSLEMTDTGFSETIKISSHQTHSPSEFPPGTLLERNSASSLTYGSTQTTPTLTSNSTVDAHISEMSTNLGKTALPSQATTITTFLSPEKESMSALSVYTPRSVEMTIDSTSVTHPISHHQDTSFVDAAPASTARLSNSMTFNTTTLHLPSLRTQSEVTSVSSPVSESTQTSPESLSLSTIGLFNANFTIISTDRITTVLSVPNVPTSLLGKTSMATPIHISQMSSLPINVTAFSSKRGSDAPTVPMTKSSKIMPTGCLKSPSVATSGPMSEISSLSVTDSAFSSVVVSSDTPTTVRSFSTSSSSVTPKTTMTIEKSTLDAIPVTYAGPTAKSTVVSSAFTTSEMAKMSSRITPSSFSTLKESTFPSVRTTPTTVMAGIVTPLIRTTVFSLLSSKNTEAVSSTPMTTFSPILSTTQQPSQGDEATHLGILPGISHSYLSTVIGGRETALTNTYSKTIVPKSVPTPSDNLHTSLNNKVSPSLTSFNNTPGPTKSMKITTYLSSNIGKMTSLSENTSLKDELTKSATSAKTPISYPPLIPSIATPLSLTSFLYSPHSIEAEFYTAKTSPVSTSHMVEFPVHGTAITSTHSQSLLKTPWNAHTPTDSRFPISTTAHVPTPNKMETATLQLVPGSLSTFTASQTGFLSEYFISKSPVPTHGIVPTFGLSESPSLPTSSRAIPTTLADNKQTLEKKTTSVTPGITLPLKPSGATAISKISKATTLPMLTGISSSLPSGSPPATISKAPQAITSSIVEKSKPTFLTSDMTPKHLLTNFTTLPFASGGTILTKSTLRPTLASVTTDSPTSLPMSIKITDDNVYISTSPRVSPRTTDMANSRTVSQFPSFSRMSMSPLTTDHTLSMGSIHLSNRTTTSSWSAIPAVSTSPTLVLPKPTLDSLPQKTTTSSTATGASFPLISTGVTHPSTATVSSLISSSFETTGLDFTSSFLSRGILTSTIAAEYTVVSSLKEEKGKEGFSGVSSLVQTLNSIFLDSEFVLTNLATQIKSRDTSEEEITMDRAILEQREGQGMATASRVPYSCVCQVIIKANSSLAPRELINKIKSKIHGNLTHGNFTQDQLMLLVKSEHVAVKQLEPGKCKADETVSKFKGTYKWLLTNPTEIAQTRCIKNEDRNATRICSISINSGKSEWEKPKLKQCKLLQELPDKIVDLANITINDENAEDVAEHILNLIKESPPLDEKETKIIIILRTVDRAGHKMEFSGRTANLTVARLALIYLGEVPLRKILASIYLPKSLKEIIPLNNLQSILFNFFGQTSLFKTKNFTNTLTTYVVSASVSDMSIQNLADPVVITLQHIEGNQNYGQVHCAFWDFDKNNGLGGWNSSGCKVSETNVDHTVCECDHLTHFGVLMDLSRSTVDEVNERILVLITYTGCGISSIFLGIAIVTYLVFHKLRKDYPSRILINLCTALLMLNLVFLINSWSASFQKAGLCITAAVALHYFLLVSLTWMGLEAVHMYFALVKVFNIYIPNYILKFCLVGWGIPAITVAIILSVKKDLYGTLSPETPFCWIKDDSVFYISVVAYFCLIFIMNLSMFCTVLAQLNSMTAQSQTTRRKMTLHDLKGTTSLTFLLGLTWGFAFFAWGPVRILFLYLFAIFNTLQGFLIFVFHCAMKESVREQWQIHLCCRWFQLDNSSDVSSRCGLNFGYKQKKLKKTIEHKLLTLSLRSTASNSTFKSLGSIQGTSSNISFPHDDFDEDRYYFSPLSREAVPNCIRLEPIVMSY